MDESDGCDVTPLQHSLPGPSLCQLAGLVCEGVGIFLVQSVDVLRLHLGIGPASPLPPLALALSLSEFRFTGLIRISYPRLPEWPPGGKPTARARCTSN